MNGNERYKIVRVEKDTDTPYIEKSNVSFDMGKRLMGYRHSWYKAIGKRYRFMLFNMNDTIPNIAGMIGVERAGYPNPVLIYTT